MLISISKLVISDAFYESRLTFVKVHQILDDIHIVYEVVDAGMKSKKELFIFTLDFDKAICCFVKNDISY